MWSTEDTKCHITAFGVTLCYCMFWFSTLGYIYLRVKWLRYFVVSMTTPIYQILPFTVRYLWLFRSLYIYRHTYLTQSILIWYSGWTGLAVSLILIHIHPSSPTPHNVVIGELCSHDQIHYASKYYIISYSLWFCLVNMIWCIGICETWTNIFTGFLSRTFGL